MKLIRAFLRAPSGIAGLAVIALICAVAILGPVFWMEPAMQVNVPHANHGPNTINLLGTDRLGRDILARILVATQPTLTLSILAAGLGAVLGFGIGASAALVRGRARTALLRTIDTLQSMPTIAVAIFIGAIVGPGGWGAALGVGIAISFHQARVASTLAMSVGGRDYIAAARVIGISGGRRFVRYVLPNIAETLIITTTVSISTSIVTMSSLSFLGLGVQPPDIDWGLMLTEGVQSIYSNPAAALGPAAAISAVALAFGFSGEALARVLNPLLWTADSKKSHNANRSSAPAQTSAVHVPSAASATRDEIAGELAKQGSSVLSVDSLSVTFPGPAGPTTIVDGVSFSLRPGEMLGIVGESGCGKTTTAMAVAQLIPHPGIVTGRIDLGGKRLQQLPIKELDKLLASNLAVVFQDAMTSLNPALRIGTQLTEAAEVHRKIAPREARKLAVDRLREVNIPSPAEHLDMYPHEFSGGMRQRAMIAMGLMNEPALLIADEPTTALDVTVQAQIVDQLVKINKEHRTSIILISHNLGLVSQLCDRVLVMYAGQIVEDLSTKDLGNPKHPYTRALLEAVPDMGRPREKPLALIEGQAPNPVAMPTGCRYHPRCPLAMDKCRVEAPPLLPDGEGRRLACWVTGGDPEGARLAAAAVEKATVQVELTLGERRA